MKAYLLIGAAIAATMLTDPAATAASAATDVFEKIGTYHRDTGYMPNPPEVLEHYAPNNKTHSTAPGVYWIIQVRKGGPTNPPSYKILFGGDPRDPISVGTAKIVNSVPTSGAQELLVTQGAAYFFGTYPYGGTDGGSGVGSGTKFVVWARPMDDYFVYLEEDDPHHYLRVYRRDDSNLANSRVIADINWYLRVSDTGPTDVARVVERIGPLDDLRRVTWEIVVLASQAGLERPLPY